MEDPTFPAIQICLHPVTPPQLPSASPPTAPWQRRAPDLTLCLAGPFAGGVEGWVSQPLSGLPSLSPALLVLQNPMGSGRYLGLNPPFSEDLGRPSGGSWTRQRGAVGLGLGGSHVLEPRFVSHRWAIDLEGLRPSWNKLIPFESDPRRFRSMIFQNPLCPRGVSPEEVSTGQTKTTRLRR